MFSIADTLDELRWRGLTAQYTDVDALRERSAVDPVASYCGSGPTTASPHYGHLVRIPLMHHL